FLVFTNIFVVLIYEVNRRLMTREADPIKPTESELEILQVLWKHGACTVRQVHEELAKTKAVGYTTTLKLMQIMHEKGLVSRDASSKTHVYRAEADQQQTRQHFMNKLIDNLFAGSASRLVMQAL